MIEFSDITLRETNGDYADVCRLMPSNKWMLRSDVFVDASMMSGTFIIHFWHDGKAIIFDVINRPLRLDLPDDDVRELSEWCRINGWSLGVDDRLLIDKRGFDYWQRAYSAALVENRQLMEQENAETKRLVDAYEKEEDDQCL